MAVFFWFVKSRQGNQSVATYASFVVNPHTTYTELSHRESLLLLQEGLFNAFATNSLLLDFDVCFASVSFLQKHSQVSNIVNIDLLKTATGLGLQSDGLIPIDH